MSWRLSLALWGGLCVPLWGGETGNINLLEKYPTTLTAGDTEPTRARAWEFTASDVFRLSGFSFRVGDSLRVEVGAADLGIGHCVDGAVWAVIIPRAEATLTSQATNSPEAIAHVWLRFHPAVIGGVFPAETVFADGDQSLTAQIGVIANAKIRSSWQAGGKAMIPGLADMTVDCDTRGGPRRFFVVDTEAETADYISAFEQRSVPIPPAITPELAASAFDQLWEAFDSDYAMFVLRPEVDWRALKEQYRPAAVASASTYQFAGICADMLKPLRDLHLWLTVSGADVPVFNRPRPSNANPSAFRLLLGDLDTSSSVLQWAVTANKIGFIVIYNWSDSGVPALFDAALDMMRGTRGIIVDVRLNGGGSEPLAQQVAARFLDQGVTYAYSQYRNGPAHTNLTERSARSLAPRGPWRYDRPVVLLIGQKCMSSSESFVAMMTCAPQVTTMGDRTAGSSGNPKIIQLPLDMSVSVPRWIDYLPDGTPLDEKGVVPQIPFAGTAEAFQGERDDLLSAALERLSAVTLPDKPIENPEETAPSGITVCDIIVAGSFGNRVYHSATLDMPIIRLLTEYGELDIPTDDLIRLSLSTTVGADVAATIQFTAIGQVLEQTISGHTPAGAFSFPRAQVKDIVFGLPASLAAALPKPAFRILWFRNGWDIESIYTTGAWGYSGLAMIAEGLGAANDEVLDSVTLTPQKLSDYDAIVFLNVDSGVPLSADEELALRDFLGAGKGILVMGQQDEGYSLSEAAQFANSVTLPYGIELTADYGSDSTQLVAHQVTKGLTSVPGGGTLFRVTPPAQILALAGTNTGVLAVSTHGAGRIVAVSDDSSLWNESSDPRYALSGQRRTYAINIFKWLLLDCPHLRASLGPDAPGAHLSFWANAGQAVHLQRSTDLKTWLDWKTVAASGAWQEVVDEDAVSRASQFYRAVIP